MRKNDLAIYHFTFFLAKFLASVKPMSTQKLGLKKRKMRKNDLAIYHFTFFRPSFWHSSSRFRLSLLLFIYIYIYVVSMFSSIYIYVSVSGCSRSTCHAARAAPVHRAAPLLQVSPVPVEVRRGCSWTRACQGAPRPTCHVARAATIKTAFPSFGTLWFSFLMLFCCCTRCCSCCYS